METEVGGGGDDDDDDDNDENDCRILTSLRPMRLSVYNTQFLKKRELQYAIVIVRDLLCHIIFTKSSGVSVCVFDNC